MLCNQKDRYNASFQELPNDQGGKGRHKCAACAHERGLALGYPQGVNNFYNK